MATRDGELQRTDDGGRTWRTVSKGRRFVSLSFVSPAAGFALTAGGDVASTSDGGRSWRVVHSFGRRAEGGPLRGAIEFVDSNHGWASPTGESAYGTISGGTSWTKLVLPCDHTVVATSVVSYAAGFLVCGAQPGAGNQAKDLYATADGGRTWTHRARLPEGGYVGMLDFLDDRTGLLVTDRGGISRTADGGRSWTQTLLTDDVYFIASTSWASAQTVYALTLQTGKLIRSDDAGRHWRRLGRAGE